MAPKGGGGTNGGGATNGNGATGGNGVAPFTGAVLCSQVLGPDGGRTGFLRLVSDEELQVGELIDSLEDAIEFGGGAVTCPVRGRSVFALRWESPTLTRFDEVDGAFAALAGIFNNDFQFQ